MIVMLLPKLIKCILIILVLYLLGWIAIYSFYGIVHPITPTVVASSIENSFFFGDAATSAKSSSPLACLMFGLYISSFFIIIFNLFKSRNFQSKIFITGISILVFMLIYLNYKNEAVKYILVLPVGLALLIIAQVLWRKRRSIAHRVPMPKIKLQKYAKDSFIFQLQRGKIVLENPYRGIYIQGGAGSGKSLSIFEPLIIQLVKQAYTGLLYDFKSPELTKKVLGLYQDNSQIKTYSVDFKNPYISHRVNPIDPKYLRKIAYALENSTVLINNLLPETVKKMDFWTGNARMILAGVIWYLRNKYPHYCTLPHVISLLLHTDVDRLINEISTDYEAGGMVSSLKQAIDRGAEKQVAGVLSTIQNGLSQLNTPDIFWILSGNDLDLHLNDPNNPKFLCIGNDSTLSSTYAPVISLIICGALRMMNQPNQAKSIVLLDEAPTLYIPKFDEIPATGRSNRIATVFGVQDYSQLVDRYGEDKAQVILANLGNQFYGRTVNVKSAEMIKNLFGKYDKTYNTSNTGSGSSGQFIHLSSNTNKGKSESIQERDRVKISDITNLGAGQFYGIIAEGEPKEFLQAQFKANEIKSTYEPTIKATDFEMKENYNRIVEEAKSII